MDFITSLPQVGEHDIILVVVDKVCKYITFIPTHSKCKEKELVTSRQPLSPRTDEVVGSRYLPTTYYFAKSHINLIEEAQEALAKAT
ncbi:unnamed protein product [Spirodela intermedia]|uniref:Uncharacterized protein n=1 Tax=Spirodela intermedia TaxID=51605 RepID=A0A7I8JPR0_SPIIN|nr:unnamed protein product [Spirodela intermedia]CAA6672110.1 unnamed protein product [Spirodela intermedia]